MAFNISYNIVAIDKFSRVNNKLSSSIDKINNKLSRASRGFTDFGKKFTTRVTLPLGAFGAIALKNAADVESFEVRLSTLLKSTEKAKFLMKDLTDFTAKTPFQLPGVVKTASQLLAFGFESEKIIDTLRVLGDVSAGSGSSLGEIGLIFGQISAAGKLTGERFLQLAERGVPIARSLSDITGIAETRIPDAISKGLIKFELVEKAFKNMTKEGSLFFRATEKQSRTLGGLFSTLKDNIFLSLSSIGKTLVETFDLKNKMQSLINVIASLTDKFNSFVKNNPKLSKFLIISTAIVALIPPIAIGLGLIGTAISSLITFVSGGIAVFTGLAAVFGTVVGAIGIVPVAIVAAIAALITLFVKVKKVRDIFFSLISVIKKVALLISKIINPLSLIMKFGISKAIGLGKEKAASGISRAIDFGKDQSESSRQFVDSQNVLVSGSESKNRIDVNINAPEGVVQSVKSKSKGSTNFNLGQNGRLAASGAY